jgi:hypothetical protein
VLGTLIAVPATDHAKVEPDAAVTVMEPVLPLKILAFCMAIVTGIRLLACTIRDRLRVPQAFVARAMYVPAMAEDMVRVRVALPLTTGVLNGVLFGAIQFTVVAAGVPPTTATRLIGVPTQTGASVAILKVGSVFIVTITIFEVEQPFIAVTLTV